MILSFTNEANETAEFDIEADTRRHALKVAQSQLKTIPGEHVWVLKDTEGEQA